MEGTAIAVLSLSIACLLITIRYYEKQLDRVRRDCARHRHPSVRARSLT